jgi:methionine-rich copper-binding protein CopC
MYMRRLNRDITKSQSSSDIGILVSITFLITIAMLLSIIVVPQSAYSHANPTSYSPQSKSVVGQNGRLPDMVGIVYSERPEPKAGYIRVTNSDNQRVDKNDYRIDANNPSEASVSLDTSKLKPGIYTVSWLALSRDDGHITKGSYVFTISSGSNRKAPEIKTATSNNFTNSAIIDNVNVTSMISPFYSGINNNFSVSLSDSDGNAPTNVNKVIMIFNNKQAGLGPISAELTKVGEGQYSESGGYLSQPGEWEVKIVVQRTDAYDLNHGFDFNVQNAPG